MERGREGLIETDGIGGAFHTALRKAVDGNASVLTWNLLHDVPDRITTSLYGHVVAQLLSVPSFDARRLREAFLSWRETVGYGEFGRKHDRLVIVLDAAFRSHPDEDWVSIAQFLRKCGFARSRSWEVDARSFWIDDAGMRIEVSVLSANGHRMGSFEARVGRDCKIDRWQGSFAGDCGDNSEIDHLPGIVRHAHRTTLSLRSQRREAKVRPEALEALAAYDLRRPLDLANPIEAILAERIAEGVEVVYHRPMRLDGRDLLCAMLAVPEGDDGARSLVTVFGDADTLPAARLNRSAVQMWIDDGAEGGIRKGWVMLDDDSTDLLVTAKVSDGRVEIDLDLRKLGEGARVLSTASTSQPVSVGLRIRRTPLLGRAEEIVDVERPGAVLRA